MRRQLASAAANGPARAQATAALREKLQGLMERAGWSRKLAIALTSGAEVAGDARSTALYAQLRAAGGAAAPGLRARVLRVRRGRGVRVWSPGNATPVAA